MTKHRKGDSWYQDLTNDYGLLIALFNVVPGSERSVINTISKRLTRYKKSRKHLYKPSFYLTWGAYDLLITMLVDDSSVVSQLLDVNDVSCQWFTLAVPPSDLSIKDAAAYIAENPEETSDRQLMPLLGVTRIKLHGYLLHALGPQVIHRFRQKVLEMVPAVARRLAERGATAVEDSETPFLMMYDAGFFDMIMLHRSRSYRDMTEWAVVPQDMKARELCLNSECSMFNRWITLAAQEDVSVESFLNTSHAIVRTYSTAAVSYTYLFDQEEHRACATDPELYPIINLTIKAGHAAQISRLLNQAGVWIETHAGHPKRLPANRTFELGMEDVCIHLASDGTLLSADDFHRKYLDFHRAIISRDHSKIPRTRDTNPLIESACANLGIAEALTLNEFTGTDDDQVATTQEVMREICSRLGLEEACEQLRGDGVAIGNPAKIALLSLLSSYKQLLTDKFQYEHMLELARAARLLVAVVGSLRNGSSVSQRFRSNLDKIIQHFDHALSNRYGTSLALSEVSDLSVEWRGDLHNMLTIMSLAHETVLCKYHTKCGNSDPDLPHPAPLTVVANVPTASRIPLDDERVRHLSVLLISGMHLVYPTTLYHIMHELGHFVIEYYHREDLGEMRGNIYDAGLDHTLVEEVWADVFSRTLLESPIEWSPGANDGLSSSAFWLYFILTRSPGYTHPWGQDEKVQLIRFLLGLLLRDSVQHQAPVAAQYSGWRTALLQGALPTTVEAELNRVQHNLGRSIPQWLTRLTTCDKSKVSFILAALDEWSIIFEKILQDIANFIFKNDFLLELPEDNIARIARSYYKAFFELLSTEEEDGTAKLLAKPGWQFDMGNSGARTFFRLRMESFLQLWSALQGTRFSYIDSVLEQAKQEDE